MGTPDTTRTLEFVRPVTSGLEVFTPLVRLHGFKIQDDLTRGVILSKTEGQKRSTPQASVAGRPRFREYRRMQLPFLRYMARRTHNKYKPNLFSLANLLDSPPKDPKSSLGKAVLQIPDELRQIALAFDSPNEESAKVKCGTLVIESAKNKNGFELLLNVQDSERFRQEGDIFNSKFATRNNVEPQTHLDPSRTFTIPLAWFDLSVTEDERNNYLRAIGPGVMNGRPLELGPISWYVGSNSATL